MNVEAPDSMCMCVMTALDKKSKITQERPTRPILNRMRYYAKNSLNIINSIIEGKSGEVKKSIEKVLKPKMIDFDILIHLKKLIPIKKFDKGMFHLILKYKKILKNRK